MAGVFSLLCSILFTAEVNICLILTGYQYLVCVCVCVCVCVMWVCYVGMLCGYVCRCVDPTLCAVYRIFAAKRDLVHVFSKYVISP